MSWQESTKEQEIRKSLSLDKIIHSSTALFYFMEYMERNNAMKYVQFLLMVEGSCLLFPFFFSISLFLSLVLFSYLIYPHHSFKKLTSGIQETSENMRQDARNIYLIYLARDAPQNLPISVSVLAWSKHRPILFYLFISSFSRTRCSKKSQIMSRRPPHSPTTGNV